jgi:hypothetical protein
MSDPVGDAAAGGDAFDESSSAAVPAAAYSDAGTGGGFSMNTGIAGASLNSGVWGAYAAPVAGGPPIDDIEKEANLSSGTAGLGHAMMGGAGDGDGFSTSMSSGGLPQANAALPQAMSNNVGAALGASGNGIGGTGGPQAIPPAGGGPQAIPPAGGGPQAIPPAGGGSPQAIPSAPTQAGVGQPAQPAQPAQPGQPGQGQPGQGPPPIPPIQWTSGGGYLSASVPNADESLASAVISAASGGGGQASLMAGTVTLSGESISAGGGATVGSRNTPASALIYGSESGTAPQFHGGAHWFGPTVSSWYEDMVARATAQWQAQQAQQAQQGGGAVGDDDGGGGAVGQGLDQALSQWAAGGGGGGGGGEEQSMTPSGGMYTNEQATAAGLDNPNTFEGLGHDPLSNTVAGPGDNPDMWSSPLGGMYSNQTATAMGLDSPDAGLEGLGHDPLSNTGGVGPGAPTDNPWY